MNAVSNNVAGSAVLIFEDSGLNVDLGFIRSRSIFFNDWESIRESEELDSLVVADKNPDRVIQNVRELLAGPTKAVTIVWNAERNKAYSYSMLAFAAGLEYVGFDLFGSTARLEIAVRQEHLARRQVPVDEIRSLIIENLRRPSNLTSSDVDNLIEDQEKLLDAAEQSILEESKLKCEVQALRKSVEQIPKLHTKLRELQSQNSRLRRRNDALARKALNKLAGHSGNPVSNDKLGSQGVNQQ
ncbi:hypothetical protein [Corynebacterium casei]|uniref:hypothetical protein n=1 Tax=Corynebacterium casei TaxID=160386 RepID=UPI003FD3D497